jgi:signal transduction histidine kinase
MKRSVSSPTNCANPCAIAAERVLLITNDPAKSSKAWDVLERQLAHLAKLLGDVLDFSRFSLRTGGGIAREQIDLRSVLMTAVEGTEATYAAQGQRLTVSLSPEPQIVRADATKLLQVFSNLLQNASRYTPSGGSVTLCSMTNGECARVTLEDTGVGISPEAQQPIFEPFVRGTSEGGGLGVGLALARRIIELHEGIITVSSDGDGLGSTFTVVLPLDLREQDDAQHTNS